MSNVSVEISNLSSAQRALLALKEARAKLEAIERTKNEPIAIIGMGCRFPGGANNPDRFWQLLREGVDAITEVPKKRWNIDDYYDTNPETPGKIYTRCGGFLEDIDQFDPQFFGISPREAVSMAPQQRLILEVSWETLENAGINPKKLAGSKTGIFLGIGPNDYTQLRSSSGEPTLISAHDGTGNGLCFASGRLSYILGLRGPNVAMDTACSSSLVAVHLACQSLRTGESKLAIAGGVNLNLFPETTIFLSRSGALSPDGRCKTFDASADGFGRSEGCGIVILKRLSDAIESGDRIFALIRGSAVNHDGSTSGFTVPNQLAQEELIRQALKNAKVEPGQISYVEAHGTGTPLGDPLEVGALSSVFGQNRPRIDNPLVIGSVKTNIGHLEAAAGIAGLIKVVLALHNEEIPPHLHYHQPNPHIDWNEIPVVVPTSRLPWHRGTQPRIAGVSSFGMSGTNAHIVIEEAPPVNPVPHSVDRPLHLLTLSAKSEPALVELAKLYENHLAAHPDLPLGDICFTANTGRSRFDHRLAVVAESTLQLKETLAAIQPLNLADIPHFSPNLQLGIATPQQQRKIAFLFTGQGSQYINMGRQLYETQQTFRQSLDRCDEILHPYLEKSLIAILYPENGETSLIEETSYTQPALFALEYALFELWKSWGIEPAAVIGHSVGEYVAATVAGVFSLEDGLKLIATRGRMMQSVARDGEMVAVWARPSEVREILQPYDLEVSIAAINAPESVVISGRREQIQAAITSCTRCGIKTRPLKVSHAFHSPLMEPILDSLEVAANEIECQTPLIPLISNLTGQVMQPGYVPDGSYWRRHAREPVKFMAGVNALKEMGCEIFLEVGPKPILSNLGIDCLPETNTIWLSSLNQGKNDWQVLLDSLSTLYVQGVDAVNWINVDSDYSRSIISLPTYPFQRKRYWIEKNNSPMDVKIPGQINSSRAHNSQRRDDIVEKVRVIIAQMLQVAPEEVKVNASFLEMGADSIFLVEGVRKIETTFGIKIAIRQFFEELTTIDALATYLERNLPPEFGSVNTSAAVLNLQALAPQPERHSEPHLTDAKASPAEPETEATSATGSSATAVERIMAIQLQVMSQVMSQQLNLLRGNTVFSPQVSASVTGDSKPPELAVPRSPQQQHDESATSKHTIVQSSGQPKVEQQQYGGLDRAQQQYLEAFIDRYTKRTEKSKQLALRSRPFLADSRAVAGFRLGIKEMLYPIAGTRYQGSRFWDLDGNEYVDIAMGFGTHLFGHGAAFIKDAINSQLERGIAVGPQPDLAGEVAQLFCEVTGNERVTFCQSGSEAVMVALRLARTATQRNRIALFAGSYHGHFDGVLAQASEGELTGVPISPGVSPDTVKDVLVLEYGDPKALEILKGEMHSLAAVLVEPVQSRRPDLQPREFLLALRQLTIASGTALIFDEIMTGFRIHPGGTQAYFGVRADLATYSKILGGGIPLAAVAGTSRFMNGIDGGLWDYGDLSYPQGERTFFAGTFNKPPLSLATCRAVLRYIKEQGPQLQKRLNDLGTRLANTLNAFFEEQQVDLRIVNFGSLFRFDFKGNMDLFFYHLIEKGVYIWEGRTCFLSTAHTEEDLEWIFQAVKESIQEMREGGFFSRQPSLLNPVSQKNRVPGGEQRPPSNNLPTASVEESKPTGFWERRKHKPSEKHAALNLESSPNKDKTIQFSLYYFGNYEADFNADKYNLLFKGAKEADRNGFTAIWIPERHFHQFGGFSPNPSVIAAALARETSQIKIRSGSVVLPLHHPIRIAEEWSVVDNLSKGRVGISFASGWNPDDFAIAPQSSYGNHRELMFQGIETVRKLWRGESIQVQNGVGKNISVKTFPMPMQPELPFWITIVNNPDTYIRAGEIGASILTNLMGQTIEDLAGNIELYRESLAKHGNNPESGHVTVLLHTFVGEDLELTREKARSPFCDYLKSSIGLFQNLVKSQGLQVDFDSLTEDDKDYILLAAYDRYVQANALIGTPESCSPVIDTMRAIGVDEVACLIDFGVDNNSVLENLQYLNDLKERCQNRKPGFEATPFPLTAAQKQLWVLAQIGISGSIAYNESVTKQLRGPLNLVALSHAIQKVVNRHEALRTTIGPLGDFQQSQPSVEVEVPLIDFSDVDIRSRESKVAEWFNQESREPFALTQGPLFRVRILKLEEQLHLLVMTAHHIIVDGWSMGVILKELSALYSAEGQGVGSKLASPMQFRDYVEWQTEHFQTAEMATHEAYWLEQFANSIPVLDLPSDRNRPPIKTYKGSKESLRIDASLGSEIKRVSTEKGCTLFMMLLSVYATLLYRLTGQSDILVGVPTAGRSLVGSEGLVGYCTHILPILSCVVGENTFSEYLTKIKNVLISAYEHQDYPFANLLEKLNLKRDVSRSTLVTATFNLDRPVVGTSMFELETEFLSQPISFFDYDIHWNITEIDGGLILECSYNTDLFDAATIQRWLGHFQTLLAAIVANPDRQLVELPLLTEAQMHQLLVEWNDTEGEYPASKCIHQLFEEQVQKTPDAIAVVFEREQLTYSQLNARANQLAHYLQWIGVEPEVLVGICIERSLEMVVGLLGILKAGGAYVPLDPDYPPDRLAYILNDSQASVLLCGRGNLTPTQKLLDSLPQHRARVVCLDTDWEAIEKYSQENVVSVAQASNLAYVIYTSGSTGKPKGVLVNHQNVVRLFAATADEFQFSSADVWTLFHSIAFDFSVWEMWGAMLYGGRLAIVPYWVSRDPEAFYTLLCFEKVTVLNQTPSAFQQLIRVEEQAGKNQQHRLRLVIFGGEALAPLSLKPWVERHPLGLTQLVNMYGITETTVHVTLRSLTMADINSGGSVIGCPIPDLQLYILDEYLQPVPIGVRGEMCVGGAGVARGYLNRPELTASRFITNPFNTQKSARLYKTGDLGRHRPDGSIEYLGRLDNQVKIRGFRIELGEIEAVLSKHPAVQETVVIGREDEPGDKRLVAYIVPFQSQAGAVLQQIRLEKEGRFPSHLRYELPNGMVISHLNKNETDFVYQEIFEEQSYLRHGIALNEGAVIFDVGANIGLFSLFMAQICKDAVIYAFEPIPPIFEALRTNTEIYGLNIKLFECGLASVDSSDEFTYYPNVSIISGRKANATDERDVVKSFLLNQQPMSASERNLSTGEIDELLSEQLTTQTVSCHLRTISDVMSENGVTRIDLLKIDVEKSELDVLAGISPSDWEKIRQLVVEVHDIDGRLDYITAMLKKHGYDLTIEQDTLLLDTGLYNIYAVRKVEAEKLDAETSSSRDVCESMLIWRSPKQLIDDVRRFSIELLPDYMVPSAFVMLDNLPLTSNGKVDVSAMPAPDLELSRSVSFVSPSTPTEEAIAGIIALVLKLERVGIHDNFFEIGGHSLNLTQVISRLRENFKVDLPLRRIFEKPTVVDLAHSIDSIRSTVQKLQASPDLLEDREEIEL